MPLHALLIFSQNDALPENVCSAHALGGTGIRFHRVSSQESQDTITALGAQRVLQAAISTASSWDYKQKRNLSASLPTGQAFGGKNAPQIEDYDVPGAYAFADAASAQRYLRIAREAIEARNKVFRGAGSVRSFSAGSRFVLSGSPLDRESRLRGESASADAASASRHFLLTEVRHAGINNLPRNLDETARVLERVVLACAAPGARSCAELSNELEASDTSETSDVIGSAETSALIAQARSRGYANQFCAQRVHVPWRPALADGTGARLNPRPTALGPQTATVVGVKGESSAGAAGEIHTDALHRVRVQFHWQRTHPDAASGGPEGQAEGASHSSAWLRIASRQAGKGLGIQFVPRIGQAVLVGFMDDDMDRPAVLGSLYDGAGEDGTQATPGGQAGAPSSARTPASRFANAKDHASAHQGNRVAAGHSPAWHGEGSAYGPMRNAAALSGFKSAEYGGANEAPHGGYSQLVFDDTDDQQRIQLATTQSTAQLNNCAPMLMARYAP
jgi:type VI secretion system secreted protein VgrG